MRTEWIMPSAAAVTASSPSSAPVGTTIWPPLRLREIDQVPLLAAARRQDSTITCFAGFDIGLADALEQRGRRAFDGEVGGGCQLLERQTGGQAIARLRAGPRPWRDRRPQRPASIRPRMPSVERARARLMPIGAEAGDGDPFLAICRPFSILRPSCHSCIDPVRGLCKPPRQPDTGPQKAQVFCA